MSASSRAVVVGGGIVGLCTARALRQQGLAVTLIERDTAGCAASWAGGGILSPLYPWRAPPAVWQMARQSLDLYPALCAELHEATGIDPEWLPSGMEVRDAGERAAALAWAAAEGLPVQWRAETQSLWLPWVAQVRNPRLCRALAVALRQAGVAVIEHMPVQGVARSGSGLLVRTAASEHHAEVVVLAAGAWSAPLAADTSWSLPIGPVKGQMIALRSAPGTVPHIVLREDRYLIPRRDGIVLVGSTVEQAGFDTTLDADTAEALHRFASGLLPALAACPRVAHWCGFRPGSPEGIPFIAPHPEWKGLWINAGHHRNGLTLAPAAAQQLMRGLLP